jgi:hypothetical protein
MPKLFYPVHRHWVTFSTRVLFEGLGGGLSMFVSDSFEVITDDKPVLVVSDSKDRFL